MESDHPASLPSELAVALLSVRQGFCIGQMLILGSVAFEGCAPSLNSSPSSKKQQQSSNPHSRE